MRLADSENRYQILEENYNENKKQKKVWVNWIKNYEETKIMIEKLGNKKIKKYNIDE